MGNSRQRTSTPVAWVCPLVRMAMLGALASQPAMAQERFRPADTAVVLASSVHAQGGRSSLRSLEQAWRAQPQNQEAALAYARAAFRLGLAEGDLRWFGSAKAALAPWWDASELSAEGFYLRGLVKQGFHDFAVGLQDINRAIALEPQHAEFWSWRFALHLLLADMAAARQDQEEIARRLGDEEAVVYRAILLYRSGTAAQGAALLRQALAAPHFQDAGSQEWLGFHWGEALRVAGEPVQAAAVWEKLLRSQPQSHLVRLALAELLNQQGQYRQALAVASAGAERDNPTDALLMQALLASRALQAPATQQLERQMAARLQSQALRQENLIERPKLIYLIAYGKDLQAGLALSIANWKLQKEPSDALLFVQAALALNQPQAARPVLEWAQATGYTDPQLAQLLRQLRSHPQWTGGRP